MYNGPSRPTFFGSLRNTFTYNGFELSLNIIYKLNYMFRNLSSSLATSMNGDYTRRWQQPGDELHTYVPSIQFPPFDNNREIFYSNSSVLIDKADHIRIQDIKLSYHFAHLVRKTSILSSLVLYGYMNNVGIIWRKSEKNIDPDVYAGIPVPRSFTIGAKFTF